ncbi:MAG: squalene--hopene cyclase [Lentisphaeria bacterium]|nr:squalene--hopene cyclase [Lentisphaeria bacterium]
MTDALKRFILSRRREDGFIEGHLSSSAVSTAVACVALDLYGGHDDAVAAGRQWLLEHQNADGLYGDSPESPANLTATFLAYSALRNIHADDVREAEAYLNKTFGGLTFEAFKAGLLKEYGRDLTFSVPLLALATASGFFPDPADAWRRMPNFPFEAAVLPESWFKYLNLPVVSYAIPALICVGLAQLRHRPNKLRSLAVKKALRVLVGKQPEDGGFLEAAPLTGFCVICLCAAGLREHQAARRAVDFLTETQRADGSWPIDRDLRLWTTSLALDVLAPSLTAEEKALYRTRLLAAQTKTEHPFTRSAPGGWAWTTYSGGVPDADDTSAALIALHALGKEASEAVCKGIEWLLDLQNSDGGIPTFCKGWGKLPFDRSCPDISAHAYKAFTLYENALPPALRRRVLRAKQRIVRYLRRVQRPDGLFVPLWFGDQTNPAKEAPAYGSAVVLSHLDGADLPFLEKTRDYLRSVRGADGLWGTVCVSARCAAALKLDGAFLKPFAERPGSLPAEPIGLYFAHLWYSEELYAPIFLAKAVRS